MTLAHAIYHLYHNTGCLCKTSTKKQKMLISRSIVEQVRTKLDPPGRFLERNADTSLWHEVDLKRALEKTAQALRDGAAPLRKKLAEEVSDRHFFDKLFDGSENAGEDADEPVSEHCI